MNFKLILGKIGIVLIAWNILFIIPLPMPLIFGALSSGLFRVFQDVAIVYGLFLLTITAGLVLYIVGRKEFSNHVKDIEIVPRLLTLCGLILMGASLWFLFFVISFLGSEWADPRTARDWMIYSLLLAWGGLGFISGVLWLIDGSKMGEGKVLPLKKEIDFEEAWKKYPKDLFARYVERYPHNPEGVLKWHIHKKKEGKTREQAMRELEKEHK